MTLTNSSSRSLCMAGGWGLEGQGLQPPYAAGSHGARNPDLLLAIGRRGAVKIGPLLDRLEAAEFQKPSHFLPQGPAQSPGGFLGRDDAPLIIEHFESQTLADELPSRVVVAGDDGAADAVAGCRIQDLLARSVQRRRAGQAELQPRVEQVDDQVPAWCEMTMHAGQGAPLCGWFQVMLKCAERHQDQGKDPPQIKRAHVALDEDQALGDLPRRLSYFLSSVFQHRRRQIETRDVVP